MRKSDLDFIDALTLALSGSGGSNSTGGAGGGGGANASDDQEVYPVGLHQFIAMAVGESGDGLNETEIKGIASSMINRMNQASTSLYDPNWKEATAKAYGGSVTGQYNVLIPLADPKKEKKRDYYQIMHMDMKDIMKSKNPGIQAAITAYRNWGTDYSNPNQFPDNGYYYWNKTSALRTSTYNKNKNYYVKTLVAGGTTFYRPL